MDFNNDNKGSPQNWFDKLAALISIKKALEPPNSLKMSVTVTMKREK